jgi:hypothetical protein
MSSEAGEGAERDETTAGASEFEGGPIGCRVELTEEDFRAVWSVLPRNRRALLERISALLAIPLFWLTIAVLDPHGWSGLMSLPIVVGSVPLVLCLRLAWGSGASCGPERRQRKCATRRESSSASTRSVFR